MQSCLCAGSGGQTRRCTRGEGGFPGCGFLPASAGQIVMVSEPFPSTIPWGPAVRVLPGMRPCGTCFASRRDGSPRSISLSVPDLGTPNPPDLPQLLPRVLSTPPAVGFLISKQRIISTFFSFYLQWSCFCVGLMHSMFAESPTNLLLGLGFPPPPLNFFHEDGGD